VKGLPISFMAPPTPPTCGPSRKSTRRALIHLTEKPVELAARAMEYSSRPGENVLDLFGGSGSTLIAAEQTGRKAFIMELDPLYCDVIVQRWQDFTGKRAERRGSSADFSQTCNRAHPTSMLRQAHSRERLFSICGIPTATSWTYSRRHQLSDSCCSLLDTLKKAA